MNERLIKWREMIDTTDGRDQMIVENWQQLSAAAWAGYLQRGRGAVVLDLRFAPNALTHPGIIVERHYLALDSLSAATSESASNPEIFREQLNRLTKYDPRREIVLFILSCDGDCLRTRRIHSESEKLLDPPEAYRVERTTKRNNPRLS